jgi:uncharacterized protein with PIN domain
MLGRLAKWLRILGYDTAYLADTDDFAVMRMARAEGRLILTRDHGLAERPGVESLLVKSENLEDQLKQVQEALGPPPNPSFSRCPVCNQVLTSPTARVVAQNVPPYVQRTQDDFAWCAACERVYWPGSHRNRMQQLVDRLRDDSGSDTIANQRESS